MKRVWIKRWNLFLFGSGYSRVELERPTSANEYPQPRSLLVIDVLISGLEFPEGPFVLEDGSIAFVEIASQRISHVDRSGKRTVLARVPGGPYGMAMGPDGCL